MEKCLTADLSVGFGACGDCCCKKKKKKATNNVQCSRRSPMSSHPIWLWCLHSDPENQMRRLRWKHNKRDCIRMERERERSKGSAMEHEQNWIRMHAERGSRASVLPGWRQVLQHEKHKRFYWRRDWEIWKLSPPQVLCEVLLKRMRMVAMQEKHKCFTILAAKEEEESAPPPSRFIASFFFASHNQPASIASVCLSSAHPTRQAKQASNPSHHHPIVCVKTTATAAATVKLIITFINKWIDHQPSPLSPCWDRKTELACQPNCRLKPQEEEAGGGGERGEHHRQEQQQ